MGQIIVSSNGTIRQLRFHAQMKPSSCFLLLIATISSCTQERKTIYHTLCTGKKLELYHVSETRFDRTSEYHELRYNGNTIARIDQAAFSHARPYRKEVYGNVPWLYLDTVAGYDRNDANRFAPMLYIDPEKCPRAAFNDLAQCLRENNKAIQQAADRDTPLIPPYRIAGLVYGREKDFEQRYRSADHQDRVIIIHPDGRLDHISKEGGMTMTSSGGLALYVALPGPRIAIEDSAQITISALRSYRHEQTGHTLETDFALYYAPKPGISR